MTIFREHNITFKSLTPKDFETMYRWLNYEHVSDKWDGPKSFDQIKEEYDHKLKCDFIFSYLVLLDSIPIGYIQKYDASKVQEGWWENEPSGTWGIDQFIGEKKFLNQGIGTYFIKKFSDELLSQKEVKRVIVDPKPENQRAIKSYQEAGFNTLRTVFTPDGKAQLMTKLRIPVIESERTISKVGNLSDIDKIIHFHKENDQEHFSKWNPELPWNFYKKSFWEARLENSIKEFSQDRSLRLLTFLKSSNELIATINYTNFERGPFQNCRLGYKIGKNHEGVGLMKESLKASIDYVFHYLQFHRIEANFIPENVRSRHLLKSLKFEESGVSTQYLKINGHWQDHVLSSLLNPNWSEG